MSATHSRSGASAVKSRSTRSGAWRPPSLTVVVTNLRRLTPARPASLQHQSRDPLAADAKTLGGKLGVNARCTVGAARGFMCDTDLCDQHRVCLGTLRRTPLDPRIVAAGGDT